MSANTDLEMAVSLARSLGIGGDADLSADAFAESARNTELLRDAVRDVAD